MPEWISFQLNLTMLAITLPLLAGVLWYGVRQLRFSETRVANAIISQITIPPIGEAFLEKQFSDVHADIRELTVRMERFEEQMEAFQTDMAALKRRTEA